MRNPFGVRGDRVVSVYDLPETERGGRCTCKCPNCGELFQTRMGEIREWHFAHRRGGCSDELAYSSGLLRLLAEHILNGGRLSLPAVYVYAPLFAQPASLQSDSWRKASIFLPWDPRSDKGQKVLVSEPKTLTFDTSNIAMDAKGRVEALLCTKNGRTVAIRAVPPATACRRVVSKPYNDLATLALDLMPLRERSTLTSNNILKTLETSAVLLSWVSNPGALTKSIPLLEQIYREQCTITYAPVRRMDVAAFPQARSPSLPAAGHETDMVSCIGCGVQKHRSEFPELSPAGARCLSCIRAEQKDNAQKTKDLIKKILEK